MPWRERVVAPDADLDALGLLAGRRTTSVRFGAIEVGPALKGAHMTSAMNKMPDADLVLDVERTTTPPDYFGGLAVVVEDGGQRIPRFTGSVVSASPTGDGVSVRALGGISLAESLIGGMTSRGLPNFELVYVLARSGGLRDEQLNIEGLDTLPRETFEVTAPIDGVELDRAVDFAGVRFLPPDVAARVLAALDASEDLRAAFEAPAYALALVTAERTLAAEEQGLMEIDVALAWLTARLRYGLATLPDGLPLAFERSESLAPRRGRRARAHDNAPVASEASDSRRAADSRARARWCANRPWPAAADAPGSPRAASAGPRNTRTRPARACPCALRGD